MNELKARDEPGVAPWRGLWPCCLLATVAVAAEAAAQSSPARLVALDSAVGQIREAPALTLRPVDRGPSLAKLPNSIAMDSRGRVYLALADAGELPAVYDRDGKFIGLIGRKGSGPGEFRSANWISVDDSDTLFVLDRANGRLSVFDPAYRFVRSAPIPVGAHALVALPGLLVVNAAVPDVDRIGFPLHAFDRVGNVVEFLELDRPTVLPHQEDPLLRALAPSGSGHLWSATMFGPHRLERVDSRGRVVRVLELSGRWLPRRNLFRPSLPRGQPYSSVAAIREDAVGRLWVVLRVPDPRWRSGLQWPRDSPDRERSGTPVVVDYHRVFDCIVAVIDPATAKVLATRRSDRYCEAMPAAGLLATVREDGDGAQLIEIARLTITRPAR